MLKNSAFKRILISTLTLFILLIIYLFPVTSNNDKNDLSYTEALKNPIYLLDDNNYVSRINILKKSDNINDNIKNIVTSLTKGTEEANYLPSGFKPIIPSGTKILTTSIDNKLLKIDFSKEFMNIDKENEIKLIESIIFSLCEFDEIDGIMIFVDGIKLTKLPNSNQSLPNVLDKSYGINKVYDITSFKGVDQTIVYYLSNIDDYTYYVPISKYQNTDNEKVEIIIKQLKTSPYNHSNLISYLKVSANLASYEILEETITLSFDNELIADLSSDNILEEVKYSIFLSLRDTYNVKSVIFDTKEDKNVSVLLD